MINYRNFRYVSLNSKIISVKSKTNAFLKYLRNINQQDKIYLGNPRLGGPGIPESINLYCKTEIAPRTQLNLRSAKNLRVALVNHSSLPLPSSSFTKATTLVEFQSHNFSIMSCAKSGSFIHV